MARKRASLKGKGQSILLSGETAEESPPAVVPETETPPEGGEGIPSVAHVPEDGEEVDWSGMLEDEVATAEPLAEEETPSPPPLPSIEHYYTEEEPTEPKAEPPTIEQPATKEPSPAPVGPVAPSAPVSAEPQPSLPVGEADIPPGKAEEIPLEVHAHEVDWSAMLEDEVATAEPPAEEVTAPPVPTIEYYYPEEEAIVPESELPVVEEAAIAEPSPAPVSPVAPSIPVPAEPQPAAITQPPPSPAAAQPPSDVPASVPRIRIGGLLAGVPLTEMETPPPTGLRPEEKELRETTKAPPKELTEDEEDLVIGRVSKKHRRELYNRISQLYREVPKKLAVSGQRVRREEVLLLLSEARDLVLEDPRQFDEAEYKVGQVEGIIANVEDVQRWAYRYGTRVGIYLTAWFVILMAGIVFFNPLAVWLERVTAVTPAETLPITVPPLLFTMVWGSLGGVLGGLYSLWRYVAEKRSFDKEYTIWYVLQPISGLLIGGIVHLLILAGFLSMFSQVSGGGVSADQENRAVLWFPALLALAFGFRQNFALALLDRVIELIGQSKE